MMQERYRPTPAPARPLIEPSFKPTEESVREGAMHWSKRGSTALRSSDQIATELTDEYAILLKDLRKSLNSCGFDLCPRVFVTDFRKGRLLPPRKRKNADEKSAHVARAFAKNLFASMGHGATSIPDIVLLAQILSRAQLGQLQRSRGTKAKAQNARNDYATVPRLPHLLLLVIVALEEAHPHQVIDLLRVCEIRLCVG